MRPRLLIPNEVSRQYHYIIAPLSQLHINETVGCFAPLLNSFLQYVPLYFVSLGTASFVNPCVIDSWVSFTIWSVFLSFVIAAMSSLSEEVLLVVKKVRQRKQDGTLYLMAERIAWGPEGKDRFTVSHLYADIRCEQLPLT